MHKENPGDFLYLVFVNLLLIIGTLALYHLIFVRRGIRFPSLEGAPSVAVQSSLMTFKQVIRLLFDFDEDQCKLSVGIDAYQYIYFKRTLLKLALAFQVIAIASILFVPVLGFPVIDVEFHPQFQFVMNNIYCMILLLTCKHFVAKFFHQPTLDLALQWEIDNTLHFFAQSEQFVAELPEVLHVEVVPYVPIKALMKQKEFDLFMLYRHELPISCLPKDPKEIPPVQAFSGHAFVTFSTQEVIESLLKQYQANYFGCQRSIASDSNIQNVLRAPHPSDIAFINLNPKNQDHYLKKILINVAMILILLFCTTPLSVLSVLGLNYDWNQSTLISMVGLVVVVLINTLLLLLIELAARFENHTSKSDYQLSILQRSAFYLTVNMLVIPALSFSAVNNLFQVVTKNVDELIELVRRVYQISNGVFFAGVIFQSGCVSMLTMLRLDELFTSWLHVGYAEMKRSSYAKLSHLKQLNDIFTYGYYYGIDIAVVYIQITFATNLPIIHLASISYFACRCYVDTLNLYTVFGEELNSNNKLIRRVITIVACSVLVVSMIDIIFFAIMQELRYTLLQLGLLALYSISIIRDHDQMNKVKERVPLTRARQVYKQSLSF